MKKAKIMLTAITVLAVVGGALAFKAKTVQTHQFFTLNADVIPVCNSAADILYTTDGILTTDVPYTTVSFNATSGNPDLPCGSTRVRSDD